MKYTCVPEIKRWYHHTWPRKRKPCKSDWVIQAGSLMEHADLSVTIQLHANNFDFWSGGANFFVICTSNGDKRMAASRSCLCGHLNGEYEDKTYFICRN